MLKNDYYDFDFDFSYSYYTFVFTILKITVSHFGSNARIVWRTRGIQFYIKGTALDFPSKNESNISLRLRVYRK